MGASKPLLRFDPWHSAGLTARSSAATWAATRQRQRMDAASSPCHEPEMVPDQLVLAFLFDAIGWWMLPFGSCIAKQLVLNDLRYTLAAPDLIARVFHDESPSLDSEANDHWPQGSTSSGVTN